MRAWLPVLLLAGCDRVFGLGDPYQDAPPAGPVTFVQAACAKYVTKSVPLTVALQNTTAGSVLVAVVSHSGVDSTLALSDDTGHAFTDLVSVTYFQVGQSYALPDIAGGPVVVTGVASANLSAPIRMCVAEYAGAAVTPPVMLTFETHGIGSDVPSLETVAFGQRASADLVSVAVIAGKGTPVESAAGFAAHATTLPDVLFEDAASIAAGQPVATIDSTQNPTYDPWFAVAVGISAR